MKRGYSRLLRQTLLARILIRSVFDDQTLSSQLPVLVIRATSFIVLLLQCEAPYVKLSAKDGIDAIGWYPC